MSKPIIFISYSHKNEDLKNELIKHLRTLERAVGILEVWCDDRIGAGLDWYAEITNSMQKASIAILIVSADFLTSEFILNKEVPELLKQREQEGLIIFPVIARHCAWQRVSWLAKMQVRPKDARPIWRGGGSQIDKDLTDITKEIADLLDSKADTQPNPDEVDPLNHHHPKTQSRDIDYPAQSTPIEVAPSSLNSSHPKLPTKVIVSNNKLQESENKSGLDKWWIERGYTSNPFVWSNAADVNDEELSRLFLAWHVDPNVKTDRPGFEKFFTLETVMSPETGQPILIYASKGGGKTFYRRWAVQRIEEDQSGDSLEITDLTNLNSGNITARDFALFVYHRICERFSVSPELFEGHSATAILRQCDELLQDVPVKGIPKRLYVFIDNVDQLFSSDKQMGKQNFQVFEALRDFCNIKREGTRLRPQILHIRLFIPVQLEEFLKKQVTGLHSISLSWPAKSCRQIVERRLDTYQKELKNGGHIGSLLTTDTLDEFGRWLHHQECVTPRCVIELFNHLTRYAWQNGVTDAAITISTWNEFLKRGQSEFTTCTPDPKIPLDQRSSFNLKIAVSFFILLLVLSVFIYVVYSIPLQFNLTILNQMISKGIIWLATLSDWLEGFFLLTILLSCVIFITWCLIHSVRSEQPINMGKCMQQAWQFIRRFLPGGS